MTITRITDFAKAELFNHSHGLFGELIAPDIVLKGLRLTDNVGRLDDPDAALATQAVHSFTTVQQQGGNEEVIVEFDNATSFPMMVRWMDQRGQNLPHQEWRLDPLTSLVRVSGLGHVFIISVMPPFSIDHQESVIGAYRILMQPPSGSPHRIVMEEAFDDAVDSSSSTTNNNGVKSSSDINATIFLVESILTDSTGYDELVIAAESLDPVEAGAHQESRAKTISTLRTILSNIQKHPQEHKFRTLRISNHKVQSQIISSWGAMQFLTHLGFENSGDDHLTLSEQQTDWPLFEKASTLLDQLNARCQPGFVAELAPPTPWDRPALSSSVVAAHGGFHIRSGTHFLSDDEKWARAERNLGRRGTRRGRRPNPGFAPSSNGPWGR
jgi:hypothetical protein